MTDNDTTPGTTAAGEPSTTPPPPTTQPIFPATPPVAPAPPAAAAPPAVPAPASSSPAAPPPPPSGDPVATPKPKRRVLTWVVRSAVTLVMLGLIGVSAYLVVVSQQWSERVDELTAVSKDLGAEVANERSAKEGALAAAEEIQGQLDTLKARVTELANEEANVRDREEALIELLDSMTNCADERAKLIDGYGSRWENSETGAVLTTRQYAAQITEYCTTVQSSIDEFLAEAD